MLGQLSVAGCTVVADFEAGVGTIMRLGEHPVDVVVVVVEPTVTSLEVGTRAAAIVTEKGLGRLVVTANRVRDDADLARVRAAFAGIDVVTVPDEPGITAAERAGLAPLDGAPDSPGVQALIGLAQRLLPRTEG